jgi:hypothetical protein
LDSKAVGDEWARVRLAGRSCYPRDVQPIDARIRLARTYVWWQAPEITLRDPHRLLCQILRYGRPEDYVAAVEIWGDGALRAALLAARRGEIDAKSTHFWKLQLGIAEDGEGSP